MSLVRFIAFVCCLASLPSIHRAELILRVNSAHSHKNPTFLEVI